ncbi:hypothetical protein [Streptomyces sp. CB03234]|uniref:hypothetical protein n=1 Tax=Streptomyces sp. (strain CB03234) TaxID=1703937 RepID=UPI00117E9360|nr:hypothetical protein [Streptomyces sp. CB03234]
MSKVSAAYEGPSRRRTATTNRAPARKAAAAMTADRRNPEVKSPAEAVRVPNSATPTATPTALPT